MRLLDCRRLTGPNLLSVHCGAIIDLQLDDEDKGFLCQYQKYLRLLLDEAGWENEQLFVRTYLQGASIAISAPVDLLYCAVECLQWCWDSVQQFHLNQIEPDVAQGALYLTGLIAQQKQDQVIALQALAKQHNSVFLSDDDEVSLGLGKTSQTWSIDQLPTIDELDFSRYQSIPIAVITGTNGKTTSVRISAHIMRTAGLTIGVSSTDWIAVNDELLDKGDYSGPGGARRVLRDNRVELAILETARGGLLRRGLAVKSANAALITNIAEDHMGDFGVTSLKELADVKWIVARAVNKQGLLVLNADDPLLVSLAKSSDLNIGWFSRNPANPLIKKQIQNKQAAACIEAGQLVLYSHGKRLEIINLVDAPITLSGAAVHNVDNLLGAALLCFTLGASVEKIRQALSTFSPRDNPGRCNLFEIKGVKALLDFAHNPHGISAFLSMAQQIPAQRKLLLIGQAGDRSDKAIRALASEAVSKVDFNQVLVKQMSSYRRGRKPGEVASILHDQFIQCGLSEKAVSVVDTEVEAVQLALDWSQPGDLLILLIHENRDQVIRMLEELAD